MGSPIRDSALQMVVEEREQRRKEMEHVPKTYWDEWDQERADDI